MAKLTEMVDPRLLGFVSLVLVLAGGSNWGFVGLFGIDLVSAIVGHMLGRLVFIFVGVAASYLIYLKVTKKELNQ